MINKMKSKAMHYWSDHKVECLVVAVLIIAYIVKQNYGDSQDELLCNRFTDCNVSCSGSLRRSQCPINH